ncbi:MAG TPA: ankyrin repeat domain-containing protein, partial [Gemmatimonadaceae bacterium]|nr:ankyrin repeat domain-containing protein [Gemmatimonadaceae bacterium]
YLPRFCDPVVTWKPLPMSDDEIAGTTVDAADARLVIARAYGFRDWDALAAIAHAMSEPGSPVREFELAVEAIIDGDVGTLRTMLSDNPALVHARSTRITDQDPAVHAATLLHYLAANGVEGHRQRSPANAVEIARLLLNAGADVNALAGMYGGRYNMLSMLVSSTPPATAGVQVALVNLLLDHDAIAEGIGSPQWQSSIRTALTFGFRDTASVFASRGGDVDLACAAGLGDVARCRELLAVADDATRHDALALATINGQLHTTALLLQAGVDPNRFNPDGMHGHQTPLHGAALAGDLPLVQLLVRHGARADVADPMWNGTPLDWARHGGRDDVIAWLVQHTASDSDRRS